MLELQEDIDYDQIMQFHATVMRKEKEAFDVAKQQKLKEVDYWTRAVKEEEKIKMEEYCAEHGNEDVKQI